MKGVRMSPKEYLKINSFKAENDVTGWTRTEEEYSPRTDWNSKAVKFEVMEKNGVKMIIDNATKKWVRYGPEERLRQWTEKLFHDLYGYPWTKIRIECPVRMGSETRFCDIAILKNENFAEEPSNYLVLIEIKSLLNDDDSKSQLLSYMRVSSALVGYTVGGKDSMDDRTFVMAYSKLKTGEIVEGEKTIGKPEDIKLPYNDLERLRKLLGYCSALKELLDITKSSEFRKKGVQRDWDGFFEYWCGKLKIVEDGIKENMKRCYRED
jgi:hypothetical protein